MEYYKNLDLKDIIYINDEGLVCWEQWKDIPDYEGFYQASDLGRIKSLNRTMSCMGKYSFLSEGRIRKVRLGRDGYLKVNLSIDGKTQTLKIHQLVAMAFLNHVPCGYKLVINHKNFIKIDNQLSNLEVVTQRENSNKKHVKSSSNFTGVSWHKKSKKWSAQVVVNGEIKYLGLFNDELEASQYYENALIAIQNGSEIKVKIKYKYLSDKNSL